MVEDSSIFGYVFFLVVTSHFVRVPESQEKTNQLTFLPAHIRMSYKTNQVRKKLTG